MNWPNRLTLLRMILVPVVMILLVPLGTNVALPWNMFITSLTGRILALVIFAVAAFSDFLDGYLARKYHQVTNFGKFLDPIADKMLVLAVFVALTQLGRITAWVPLVVLFREFAVTGMRLLAIEKGIVIAAGNLGKLKTVTQMIALIMLLIEPIIFASGSVFGYCSDVVVVLSVVLTLASGAEYIVKNRMVFCNQ